MTASPPPNPLNSVEKRANFGRQKIFTEKILRPLTAQLFHATGVLIDSGFVRSLRDW
jgi:hypothetical protein